MLQIKNRWNGSVIKEVVDETLSRANLYGADLSGADLSRADLSRADLSRANLSRADLSRANLSRANLSRANLSGANLSRANLSRADLSRANLSGANLSGADLSRADLSRADLSRANLSRANLSRANLSRANLSGANLSGADLSGANLEFCQFPSIRLLSSIDLEKVTKNICLELMRRDALAHPNPDKFDEWAKGGQCPYEGVDRFWIFNPIREVWKPGLPEMADRDLILAICKEKGWGIRGFYDPKKETK